MEIKKNFVGTDLTIELIGRLDTTTAPELEAALKGAFNGIETLTLDFSNLEYISSAGLRVLLLAQKTMNQKGGMKLISVSEEIKEVFDITGFADILTIE